MRHYVTLFDKNYLVKGLCLYQSLIKHSSEDFRLWVIPLDSETTNHLINHRAELSKIQIVWLKDLPQDVKRQRQERPWNYYCFGLAPELTAHIMWDLKKDVTYLDADTYFWQDPKLVFDEMADKEVGIVSHNFPAHDYNRLIGNGKFNVSLVSFRYTEAAKNLLKSWRDGVRIQCDKESCGDQRYLDSFPDILGDKLHIFDGKYIGLGPWNQYMYNIVESPFGGPSIEAGGIIIFSHFHEFKYIGNEQYYLTGYPVTDCVKKYIYDPYIKLSESIRKTIC